MIAGSDLDLLIRRESKGRMGKSRSDPDARNAAIARKLERTASRSTRATVGRITGLLPCPFSLVPFASPSPRAMREVFKPRMFLDERQLRGSDRTVALLADDDLGRSLGFLVRVAVGVAVLLLAEDEHHDVCILFEGAGLAEVGQLRAVIGSGLGGTRQLRQRH